MIFVLRGRLTEAPKPPATQPQRRNFMAAIDAANPNQARELGQKYLEKAGFGFISINRMFVWERPSGDKALDTIVDHARRHGAAHALYL